MLGATVPGRTMPGVDARERDVRRHHDVHARRDRGPERHQLDRVEPRPGRGDDGQREVRVGAGVAVAGEVLGRREHAVVLQAAHLGRDHAADLAPGPRRRSAY